MSEKSLSFEYQDDDRHLVITSTRASAKVGVARFQLMLKADEFNKNETDDAIRVLRLISYPDCISCSMVMRDDEAWKPTLEEFVELDEVLVNQWIEQVYNVNPQWVMKPAEGGAAQAKKENEPQTTSKD
jgi:hypothetical protein